eukprot:TRINITY_DN93507_c0_g1_i1.p1 TRINITY_DN93507_c0_g1~~TRINITY_DN93507_c0_g1_i1.p1  ORF type:complete len:244 (+),score=36.36 TRINITY_DN93507_c0_g1_i1:66-734(+)
MAFRIRSGVPEASLRSSPVPISLFKYLDQDSSEDSYSPSLGSDRGRRIDSPENSRWQRSNWNGTRTPSPCSPRGYHAWTRMRTPSPEQRVLILPPPKPVILLSACLPAEEPEKLEHISAGPAEGDHRAEEAAAEELPPEYPSIGSIGHPRCCKEPCKYVLKGKGCKDGPRCDRCHICKWRNPRDGYAGYRARHFRGAERRSARFASAANPQQRTTASGANNR